MSKGGDRTNAMRILDARGAAYEALSFPASEAVSALEAAHPRQQDAVHVGVVPFRHHHDVRAQTVRHALRPGREAHEEGRPSAEEEGEQEHCRDEAGAAARPAADVPPCDAHSLDRKSVV